MNTFYTFIATLLCGMAVVGLFQTHDLLRRIVALNVLASAVFLLLVSLAKTASGIDPVPHVMVLTGIVVAVSTTAAALALVVKAEVRRRQEAKQ